MRFTDRMPESREYADPTDPTQVDISSSGWSIDYISSTFLEGWINYVKPVKAFVIRRYSDDGEDSGLAEKVKKWHEEEHHHTKLGVFGDDVMMLCRSDAGDWWYFWFDCDSSDCSIGKFEDELGADVPAEFVAYVQDRAKDLARPAAPEWHELDVKKISGWVSFH